MNNGKAAALNGESSIGAMPHRQRHSQSHAVDPVRDFFHRGDRGQYEGGPADCIDSTPTWDVPDKPHIVRTPKQQARRRALAKLEAVLLSGCVVLLVMAARARSNHAVEPVRSTSAQSEAVIAAAPRPIDVQTPAHTVRVPVAPQPPSPKAAETTAAVMNQVPAKASATLEAADKSHETKGAAVAITPQASKAVALTVPKRAQEKPRSVVAARSVAGPNVEPRQIPTSSAPPRAPAAAKHAVAAFPDD